MKTLGERIKIAREKQGLTQVQLADLLGVKGQTVYRWEKGERNPDYETLMDIAIHLSVNVSDLLENADLAESCGEDKLGLNSSSLKYWEKEAAKIRKLLNTENADAFAQIEDIYIREFNETKEKLYKIIGWAEPMSYTYSLPYPDKLGGLHARNYKSDEVYSKDISNKGLMLHETSLVTLVNYLRDRIKKENKTLNEEDRSDIQKVLSSCMCDLDNSNGDEKTA